MQVIFIFYQTNSERIHPKTLWLAGKQNRQTEEDNGWKVGKWDGASQGKVGKWKWSSLIFQTKMDNFLFEILLKQGDDAVGLQWLMKETKVEITSSNPLGGTLLILASKHGRYECCKFLLELNVSMNMLSESGFSALHYAAFHGFEKITFLLLEKGANPMIKNVLGETPLDSCRKGRNETLLSKMESSFYFKRCCEHDEAYIKKCKIAASTNGKLLSRSEALKYQLVLEDGRGTKFDLFESPDSGSNDVTIGRSRDNKIILGDQTVGKHHAIISYFENVGFLVREEKPSKHGTFVNGVKITIADGSLQGGLILVHGTSLKFGKVVCKLLRKQQESVISKGYFSYTIFSISVIVVISSWWRNIRSPKLFPLSDLYHCISAAVWCVRRFEPNESVRELLSDAVRKKHLLEEAVAERRPFTPVRSEVSHPHPQQHPNPHPEGGASARMRGGDAGGWGAKRERGTTLHDRSEEETVKHMRVSDSHSIANGGGGGGGGVDDGDGCGGDKAIADIGGHLLAKMGWTFGRALGKMDAAANAPIEVVQRPERAGLGAVSTDSRPGGGGGGGGTTDGGDVHFQRSEPEYKMGWAKYKQNRGHWCYD
jgi:hypothetical protein